jgi:diaminohydroxyphosphoribosylaminopyrimidine deaminase/5-amino-6-(5-phosphoribosylamino)uracil reductase
LRVDPDSDTLGSTSNRERVGLNSSDIEHGARGTRESEATPAREPTRSAGGDRSVDATDEHWMQHALDLARRGRCGASPNPMVGAAVIDPEGCLVGEGYHACCGGPHAEVNALAQAADRARGGTIYITLEPCAHHGRTPPCVEAIIAAGIRRVVVAMNDPNPVASGGLDLLRAESIEVNEGVGSESGRILNRRWLRWAQTRQPWVTAKAAISLDGRIATRTGHSKWITGKAARNRGLELREEHDAILVGIDTVLADDPRLTRRLGLNPGDDWRRVILDSKLRIPSDAIVVQSDPEMTIVAHTAEAAEDDRERLNTAGVQLVELPTDDSGRIDISALLDHLGDRGVAALLVEGGATVHGSFFDADLVDEIYFFVAPLVIGGEAPAAISGLGVANLDLARHYHYEDIRHHGTDLELHCVRPEDADVHGSD